MKEAVEKLSAEAMSSYQAPTRERLQEEAKSMVQLFGNTWGGAVGSYTECTLTKASDRLIAISSTARELSNTGILQGKNHLAGHWDVNLVLYAARNGHDGVVRQLFEKGAAIKVKDKDGRTPTIIRF